MGEHRVCNAGVRGSNPLVSIYGSYTSDNMKSIDALVAQSAERILGKNEVTGSNPVEGSRFCLVVVSHHF